MNHPLTPSSTRHFVVLLTYHLSRLPRLLSFQPDLLLHKSSRAMSVFATATILFFFLFSKFQETSIMLVNYSCKPDKGTSKQREWVKRRQNTIHRSRMTNKVSNFTAAKCPKDYLSLGCFIPWLHSCFWLIQSKASASPLFSLTGQNRNGSSASVFSLKSFPMENDFKY